LTAGVTALVLLVGEHGLGPWQMLEYYEALGHRCLCSWLHRLELERSMMTPGAGRP